MVVVIAVIVVVVVGVVVAVELHTNTTTASTRTATNICRIIIIYSSVKLIHIFGPFTIMNPISIIMNDILGLWRHHYHNRLCCCHV